jgi:hypothetical protein
VAGIPFLHLQYLPESEVDRKVIILPAFLFEPDKIAGLLDSGWEPGSGSIIHLEQLTDKIFILGVIPNEISNTLTEQFSGCLGLPLRDQF